MSARRKTPANFSAYLVTWSDQEAMPVGATLIDKGNRLERDWNVMDFKTGVETGASGVRVARLCPDCKVRHGVVGILGHDGDCGIDAVKSEALAEIKHAIKKHEASR